MENHAPRGASNLKRASSRVRDSTLLPPLTYGGSPGGTDIFGKLTAILRGNNAYSELVDDNSFDDPRYSGNATPPCPLTPASPHLTWDLDSPRSNGRVRSNTTTTVARLSSAMRRQSLSPRRRSHDAILVTEFKFLHKSFAPPFPLAACQTPDIPAAPVSPFRASVDDVLFDNNSDHPDNNDDDISIDPDNLRDSVRHLVRHIQRHDSGDCPAMLECSDVLSPDLDTDDDHICLLGSSPGDRMSSDAYPAIHDDTSDDLSPERSSGKDDVDSIQTDDGCFRDVCSNNQDADGEDTSEDLAYDDDDMPILTTSVRNLVLNLRRDCARQSLHPADLIGVPATHHHHHHYHHNPSSQARAYQPSIRRRRNHSHPPDLSPSNAMQPAAPPPPRDSKPPHFSRLMSSVAGGLRRLSIHKSKAPAAARASSYAIHQAHSHSPGASHAAAAPDIDGARWKIVELAFRFGGPHRYYLVQAVNMFYPLTKYGRRGGPHTTRLVCHPYGTLQWEHKRGGFSAPIDLALASHVVDGRETAVFHKCDGHGGGYNARSRACSLSVVFAHRTLDLETQSADHRDWLGSALRTLMQYAKKQRQAEAMVINEEAAAAAAKTNDTASPPVMAPIIA